MANTRIVTAASRDPVSIGRTVFSCFVLSLRVKAELGVRDWRKLATPTPSTVPPARSVDPLDHLTTAAVVVELRAKSEGGRDRQALGVPFVAAVNQSW